MNLGLEHLAQVPFGDLRVPIIRQLAAAQPLLRNAPEPGPLTVVRLDAAPDVITAESERRSDARLGEIPLTALLPRAWLPRQPGSILEAA